MPGPARRWRRGGRSCGRRWRSPPTIFRFTSSPSSPARRSRRCTAAARSCCPTTTRRRRSTRRPPRRRRGFGLAAYEVSNYAQPGAESRHNLAYWRYGDYAGIGPGAHGRVTLGGDLLATRRHRAPEPWAERVERTARHDARRIALAPAERAREMLLMGLRLREGIDEARFAARTGCAGRGARPRRAVQAIGGGLCDRAEPAACGQAEGRLRLDALLGQLVA